MSQENGIEATSSFLEQELVLREEENRNKIILAYGEEFCEILETSQNVIVDIDTMALIFEKTKFVRVEYLYSLSTTVKIEGRNPKGSTVSEECIFRESYYHLVGTPFCCTVIELDSYIYAQMYGTSQIVCVSKNTPYSGIHEIELGLPFNGYLNEIPDEFWNTSDCSEVGLHCRGMRTQ